MYYRNGNIHAPKGDGMKRIRIKYAITIMVMALSTILLWFGKVADTIWRDIIGACLIAILIGFSVKTALEIIKAWKGQ
jgi:hypothetical protein